MNDELKAAGAWTVAAGLELDDAATTLRATQGERVLTDGPFAETKELLFSYYVIDVADLDAAATSSTTRATPPPPATT
ncbi:MAG TPA: YciI family protein [Acidimicrobiales bacterium]|nr:YciI family protein [Acidimicrobiales bacterium]